MSRTALFSMIATSHMWLLDTQNVDTRKNLKECCIDIDKFELLFFKIIIYLFILGCVGSSFLCEGFLQLWQAGPLFIAVRRPLTIAASLAAEHRLQTRRLSSCGSRA